MVSGWTKNTPKPKLFKNRKNHQKRKNPKRLEIAKISDTPIDQRSLIHREAWFLPCAVRQNQPKKNYFYVWRLRTTSKQKCSNVRPLLSINFPQGFQISKNIGHQTLGSGGKKMFQRYLKSEQMDRRTDLRKDGHADGHFDL